jgi:hypothetical protein
VARSSVTMKWNGDKILRKLEAEIDSRLLECAQAVAEQMRDNVSEHGPPASTPGDFPHRITGELEGSIRAIQNKKGEARVVAEAEHAPYVEKLRPFFRRTHREMRSRMRAIMLGKGRGTGRFKFLD